MNDNEPNTEKTSEPPKVQNLREFVAAHAKYWRWCAKNEGDSLTQAVNREVARGKAESYEDVLARIDAAAPAARA